VNVATTTPQYSTVCTTTAKASNSRWIMLVHAAVGMLSLPGSIQSLASLLRDSRAHTSASAKPFQQPKLDGPYRNIVHSHCPTNREYSHPRMVSCMGRGKTTALSWSY